MLTAPVWGEQNFANVFGHLKRSNQANAAEILARSTGGLHLPFFRQQALETLIARIGEEIHGQYLLTFAAKPAAMETFRQHLGSPEEPPPNSRSGRVPATG